jgi:hypothetical protein
VAIPGSKRSSRPRPIAKRHEFPQVAAYKGNLGSRQKQTGASYADYKLSAISNQPNNGKWQMEKKNEENQRQVYDEETEEILISTTPPERVEQAHAAARCAHVKPSGMRCGSPAMRDIEFCYYHKRTHIGPRLLYPTMTMLEDGHGVQAALMEVLCAIMDGVLSDRQAALMLYGLQTAASNLKRVEQVDPQEVAIEPAPEEKLPEGVFERKRDQWSPEEKIAIEKFMQEMTVKKAWRQSEEERRSG